MKNEKLIENAAHGYKKYRDGSSTSDEELDAFIEFADQVVSFLAQCGDEFLLTWKELALRSDQYKRFRETRNTYKDKNTIKSNEN